MTRFVARRLGVGAVSLWVVVTLTFAFLRMIPGGPFDKERVLPPEIQANLAAKYHLDESLASQYARYLGQMARGDLGPSYKYLGRSVNDILRESFPVSAQLGLLALLYGTVAGIAAGLLAGMVRGRWPDKITMIVATTGISLPTFVIGVLLILLFAHTWKLLPPALWEGPAYMVLPALTLGLAPAAYIARLTRSSVLDVMNRAYITAARAKGVGGLRLALQHVLKNAILPVATLFGPLFADLLTGSFVVEYIFGVPGMGRFFITAVTNRDYPLVMGVTVIYAALVILANLAVDLSYRWLDPRVEMERPEGTA
ncbi:MAG: ABC transporter permease [Myxococcota bacterium]